MCRLPRTLRMHQPPSLTGGLRRARHALRAFARLAWVVALSGCPAVDPAASGTTATTSALVTGSTPLAAAGGPATSSAPSLPAGGAVDAGPRLAAASLAASAPAAAIDMVFWEKQSWKPGGRADRLTLWADGRAETWVMPTGKGFVLSPPPRPRPGWQRVPGDDPGERLRFVRSDSFPRAEVKRRFAQAVAAGIDRLETFKPHYRDGTGTLVGFRRGGKLQEITLPAFPDAQHGSENHRRYLRVAEAFAGYDTKAF